MRLIGVGGGARKSGCYKIGMSTNEGFQGLLLWDFVFFKLREKGVKNAGLGWQGRILGIEMTARIAYFVVFLSGLYYILWFCENGVKVEN